MKEETVYSTPCRAVKAKANTTVSAIPYNVPLLYPCIIEWWAYVTVNPEDSNKTVLSSGNSKGLTDSIPSGGHCAPISTAGDKALWNKVQKIARKKNASLTINKATPMLRPLCTAKV